MKLLTVITAATTLAVFVDAMVSVNAVASNSLDVRGHDTLSLLGLLGRRAPPLSEHDVGPMLKSAESMLMNLAAGHKSAPLADLVAQIRPFISQMQDSINVAHNSAQQALTQLGSDISGCNTAKATGDAEVSSLETTKQGHSNDHKSCRTRQKTANDEVASCQLVLTALEGAKKSSCQLYEDAKKTPGCGEIPANAGETWESYVSRAATYFVQERDTFMNKKAVCNNDTAKLDAQKTLCSGASQKTFDDTKKECNDKQTALESATCSYVSKVNSTCNGFATCANTLADSFDTQKSSIETLEHQRKVEWNATERLLCLLDVYGGSGGVDATKLQTCQHIADNTSHLNLVYPTIPRPSPCAALLPHPCDADYTQAEYGSLDAPAGNCTPCAFASAVTSDPKQNFDNGARGYCATVDSCTGFTPRHLQVRCDKSTGCLDDWHSRYLGWEVAMVAFRDKCLEICKALGDCNSVDDVGDHYLGFQNAASHAASGNFHSGWGPFMMCYMQGNALGQWKANVTEMFGATSLTTEAVEGRGEITAQCPVVSVCLDGEDKPGGGNWQLNGHCKFFQPQHPRNCWCKKGAANCFSHQV